MHRTDTLIADTKLRELQKEKVHTGLCIMYPEWALEEMGNRKSKEKKDLEMDKTVGCVLLPYCKGISVRLHKLFK